MLDRLLNLISKAWQRFRTLPLAAAVAVGVVVFAGFAAAGIWGYKKWDYIEHDNNFCLDCHLMQAPFELVSESAHRDMSCKACHNPGLLSRASMGLAQVIKNPDSLTVHAEVPNEACASCHVYGDPEEWTTIARSVGHRIHFESDNPDLAGLMCVECHSTSVHQFSSTDATCRECHEDNNIVTAGMHDVDMNCGTCHAFNAPLEAIPADAPLTPSPEGALERAMSPTAEECLSCHLMRTTVQFSEDDPHEAACGLCHNPHNQEIANDALASCATAGCHDEPLAELSTFHEGVDTTTLATCTDCHAAHDFHADGQDCQACHTDIFDDVRAPARVGSSPPPGAADAHPGVMPGRERPVAPEPASRPEPEPSESPDDRIGAAGVGTTLFVGIGLVERVAPLASHGRSPLDAYPAPTPAVRLSALPGPPSAPDTTFLHSEHRDVACLSCHSMDQSHGQVTVHGLGDCRQCHHSTPLSEDCTACHDDMERDLAARPVSVAFALTVGDAVERSLPFDHADHTEASCDTCHGGGVTMSTAAVDCTGCHEEHHGEDANCRTCHTPSPRAEHTVQAHVGCATAGCHTDAPFEGVPKRRELCLVCHVEQADHKSGAPETCADCHALPEPGTMAGVGP